MSILDLFKKKNNDYNNIENEFDPNKIIIKSTEELKHKNEHVEEVKEETPVQQVPSMSTFEEYQLPNMDMFFNDSKIIEAFTECDDISIPLYINDQVELVKLSDLNNLFIYGIQESGKSFLIHSIIDTLLITQKPNKLKMIIIDTKKLEYSNYNGIPHLLCPVVSDPKKASIALQNVVKEMEHRYDIFSNNRVKNINEYNELFDNNSNELMPNILIVIDELNDLTIIDKELTSLIEHISKHSKATGISLMCVSSNIVPPAFNSILFSVLQSKILFKTYNQSEIKKLLGNGINKDLNEYEFYLKNYNLKLNDTYTYYKYSSSIEDLIIKYVSKQSAVIYDESINESSSNSLENEEDYEDPLMNEIIDFAIISGKISPSLIQRRFRLGYNRAARIIDELEDRGIIGPQNGSKPREVLVKLNKDE